MGKESGKKEELLGDGLYFYTKAKIRPIGFEFSTILKIRVLRVVCGSRCPNLFMDE